MRITRVILFLLPFIVLISCEEPLGITIYPQPVTEKVTEVGEYSASFHGYIRNWNDVEIKSRTPAFLVHSKRKEHLIEAKLSNDGKFEAIADFLSSGTEYSYQAVALDSTAILSYGKEDAFTTLESNVIYMSLDGDNSSGKSWEEGYSNLSEAINEAMSIPVGESDTVEIWIKGGLYNTVVDSRHFDFDRNLRLIGGFSGIEKTKEDRNSGSDTTVFSEQHALSYLNFPQGNYILLIDEIKFNKSAINVRSINVAFKNCVFTGYRKPRLTFEDNKISFINCKFVENELEEQVWIDYLLLVSNSEIQMDGCEFSNNKYYRSLFRISGSYGLIENTSVINNLDIKSGSTGAVVDIIGNNTKELLIQGCQFENNTKKFVITSSTGNAGGSAIFMYEAFVRIENSEFTKNISHTAPAIYNSVGGTGGRLSLKNCNIHNNLSTGCTETLSTRGAIEILSTNFNIIDLGGNCLQSNWQSLCNGEGAIEGADCAGFNCDSTESFDYCD